ncbi:MAG TPA: PQQ-dependent sugar dehydrogenase [Aeromicrobium sp.]|nr:PQQ-dependent sugar dehydrogenase [Aeromicrobium sp.]
MRLTRIFAGCLVAAGMLVGAGSANGATVPSGYTDATVASGLNAPTAMDIAPDGRIFVAEQGGQLRIIKGGRLLGTPFVSLSVDATGERGLLGVAFDPNFPASPYVYLYYTVPGAAAHNRVSRFTANGDAAQAGSEVVLLDLDNLSAATNHNGGAIHFGPDGKLYVAVGENANGANSQTLANRLGKILRINADGSIPTDNPFYGTAAGANRAIWAYGLRNPFTFAFRRGSSRMFVNDVGQSTWEEINDGIAGSNYGWPTTEGPTTNSLYRSPFHAYMHSGSPGGCAIAGGTFHDPRFARFPASYAGDYFFADLCGGWIRSLDVATKAASPFASGIDNPVDLKVGNGGSLYYLARGTGSLGQISRDQPRVLLNDQLDASAAEDDFRFGAGDGRFLACDWDGDGTETVGMVRNGIWWLTNSHSGDAVQPGFAFGKATDVPICGDWDGNGTETPGVRRGNVFYLRNSNSTGAAGISFAYGLGTDRPIVGDWNGSGGDGVGVVRGNAFYLTNRLDGTRDIAAFSFGRSGDVPLAGDWDLNGTSTVGVRRGSDVYLSFGFTGAANAHFAWGSSSDFPLAGDWNGDGRTTIGLVRR